MKKRIVLCVSVAGLAIAAATIAAQSGKPKVEYATNPGGPPASRQEQITRIEKRISDLEKRLKNLKRMSDEDWAQRRGIAPAPVAGQSPVTQQPATRILTPEQRKQMREKLEKRKKKKQEDQE